MNTGPTVDWARFCPDADRHAADLGRPDVDAGRRGAGAVDPLLDRERVGHEEAAAAEGLAVFVGQHRERPGTAAAEAEALAGPARIGVLAEVDGPGDEQLVAAVVEGLSRDEVERGAEDDQDEQRREAAPRDELPADAADEPAVGAQRLLARRRRPRVDGAPSRIAQTVPHAADRLDPRPEVAELGPEVVDVGVDGVRRDRDAERPCLVEELVAGQRLAGVAEEALEQRELARAQVDVATAGRDPALTSRRG